MVDHSLVKALDETISTWMAEQITESKNPKDIFYKPFTSTLSLVFKSADVLISAGFERYRIISFMLSMFEKYKRGELNGTDTGAGESLASAKEK